MAKKTVIVEENQDDVLFHPRVIAKAVDELKQATADGFKELKTEIHNQSANFATQSYVESSKRESELKHDELRIEIADVRRETNKNSKIIAWVGRTIIMVVLLTILASIGLNVAGMHH